jgi:hypothetical protein
MFCPKCSHQQATETVRFCSRCGFQLDVVKDLLASESAGEATVSLKDAKRSLLRQVDILIGAGFMLVGSIKAAIISTNINVAGTDRLEFALYFLGLGFALFLLFAQLSHRQRGLTLGATLVFAGALVAFAALEFLGLPGLLLIALILFPIIIFWTRLSGLFMKTFFDKDEVSEEIAPASRKTLLPAAESNVIEIPKRVKTADMAQPPSVTEDTTSLLEKG